MRTPERPDNETARLQDLHAYGVIEPGSEPIFQVITELAAMICGTRFAVLALIDTEQWCVQASHGLNFQNRSRDDTICAHAILENDVFEVPNISADERFFDNPALNAHPRLRFYAGGQLLSNRGNAVGMLCVLDSEPGELDENQRNSLRQLSRIGIAILEARRKAPDAADWMSGWIANVTDEVYIRDPESMQYLFANDAALRRAGCSLAQLLAGEHLCKPEGDDVDFPEYVRRLQSGEFSLSFEAIRNTVEANFQTVDVSWSLLKTADSSAILSIVRERRGV